MELAARYIESQKTMVDRKTLREFSLPHLRVGLYGDCNFRCTYCPPWGENDYRIGENLDSDQLMIALRALAAYGFRIVKFSGGEPTLRRDLIQIIETSSHLFHEVRLITNGWNLARIGPDLRNAGLAMVEVSIDAAEGSLFDQITQTKGRLRSVLEGLSLCRELGIAVQLNTVVMRQNLDQVGSLIDLVERHGPTRLKLLELVYYEYPGIDFWKHSFVDMGEIIPELERRASSVSWEKPPGAFGTPMRIYEVANGSTIVVKDGKLGAVYADVCDGCPLFPCQDGLYGLSLTADGSLKMCKHRPDLHISIKTGSSDEVNNAVMQIADRYRSAYYLTEGWRPELAEQRANTRIVEPDAAVMLWYQRARSSRTARGAQSGPDDH
jgi:cyclic pyranopterin phosphate synthase